LRFAQTDSLAPIMTEPRSVNSSIRVVLDERLPGLNTPLYHSILIVRSMLASVDHPAFTAAEI